MVISMLKIRRSLGRLIFNMGITIPGKTVFLIETAPWKNCSLWPQVSVVLRHSWWVVVFQGAPVEFPGCRLAVAACPQNARLTPMEWKWNGCHGILVTATTFPYSELETRLLTAWPWGNLSRNFSCWNKISFHSALSEIDWSELCNKKRHIRSFLHASRNFYMTSW